MTVSKQRGPVQRWVHAGDEGRIDAELGDVFRSMVDEAPLSDAALARVGRRLGSSRKRHARLLFRLVPVGIAVLVGGSGAALAQWAKPGIWDTRSWFEMHAAQPPSPIADAAERLRAPSRPTVAPALPAPQPVARRAPSALVRPAERSPAAPSDIAIESELLRRALEMLRRDHDGAAALEVLDEHRARFPAGVLTLEASVARIDALLLLSRRDEALQQLSRLALERVGRRTELQLLRAELNAERDCGKALSDFDAVLGATAPAGLIERALYGRANCRLRLGDTAGSNADLDSYLSRFPQGRFAIQVRARPKSSDSF